MGRHGRADQRMLTPAADKIAAVGQALLVRWRVGRGEFEDRLATDRAHTDIGGSGGDLFFIIVHVGKASHAGKDHLGAGQARAQPAKIGVHELTLDGHHIAMQPYVQAQVIGQPAQQRHWHVGMGVNQARHHGCAATVNHLTYLGAVQQRVSRP